MVGNFKLLHILLLALLFTSTVTSELIVSINCGGTGSIQWFSDHTAFIQWTSDDTLISNGEAHVIPSSNSVSDEVMDTLRVFTSRKKNCYSYPVTLGQKVLVRATFNYGNYDGLSKPPTFNLHFDGNFWTTVETSSTELTVHEITYVTKGNEVSVCVAQTKENQLPFMTALEIRSVESGVYYAKEVDSNRALFLISRLAYGASQTIRYPDDNYDRMWMPVLDLTDIVTSDNPIFNFDHYTSTSDDPPQAVFQNAMSSSKAYNLSLQTFSPSNSPYLINMYFSEVNIIDTSRTRSFKLYETSTSGSHELSSHTMTPPIKKVYEWYMYNHTVNSTTTFSLNATHDSDLPPLINAMEVFRIGEVMTTGTDSNDVAALALLQSTFNVLQGWSGDPCLPAPYSWDWLNCSNDDTPRVTSLYLNSSGLSGFLPDISSMDALEIIDLHNNTLIGAIPSFLGTMPNLQRLDLADNQFSGPVPASLSKKKNLKLDGNPSLCTSGKSCSSSPGTSSSSPGSINIAGKKKSKLPVILGTTIPSFLLIWIAAGILTIVRRKRKHTNANGSATGGGATNGITNGLQKMGEDFVNEIVNTGAQQIFGSPSPLLDVNSGGTTV